MAMIAPLLAVLALAPVQPAVQTEPVAYDADDPAIWIHPKQPSKSLVLGTDKKNEKGGVSVFDLKGKTVQRIEGVDRPNNIDVEYGFNLDGKKVDIAVATERGQKRLRVWTIDAESGKLADATGNTAVFADRKDEMAAPMGIGLYACKKDGQIYALVSSKAGPEQGYLHLYRLAGRSGKIDAVFVRALGKFSGKGDIEAIVVDDKNDVAYYSDEGAGIRKVGVLPDGKDEELALFGTEGYQGDREGLALWRTETGMPYLLSIDQIKEASVIRVYEISGSPALVGSIEIASDSTDGLEACFTSLGEAFPEGVVVAMNSKGKNFHFYRPSDLIKRLMGQ